ncbi:hypothetical protein N7478_001237 [Penicillium angulare]|uniref:uncharacterized protein n=1 Tax=Penicillium angulare TaxID=116970 RepID=UPI002541A1CB|nr:uncharacterized protein N7478_001237 [Penicillium angulare]KAJ5291986.1 hypothetical protein N7478_001237 [Penicillium angulare]
MLLDFPEVEAVLDLVDLEDAEDHTAPLENRHQMEAVGLAGPDAGILGARVDLEGLGSLDDLGEAMGADDGGDEDGLDRNLDMGMDSDARLLVKNSIVYHHADRHIGI